jgi:hypothetical protein
LLAVEITELLKTETNLNYFRNNGLSGSIKTKKDQVAHLISGGLDLILIKKKENPNSQL